MCASSPELLSCAAIVCCHVLPNFENLWGNATFQQTRCEHDARVSPPVYLSTTREQGTWCAEHSKPWNTVEHSKFDCNLAHQDDNTGFVQVSETKIQGYSKSFKTLSEIFQGCTVASHVASLYDTKVSKMYKQQSCSAVHCYLCLNYLIMNYQRIKLCCTLRM